jgi:hypothetical protein
MQARDLAEQKVASLTADLENAKKEIGLFYTVLHHSTWCYFCFSVLARIVLNSLCVKCVSKKMSSPIVPIDPIKDIRHQLY